MKEVESSNIYVLCMQPLHHTKDNLVGYFFDDDYFIPLIATMLWVNRDLIDMLFPVREYR